MTKIYFDMDGTVYGLYQLKNWLRMLEEEREEVFSIGSPLVDMDSLCKMANKMMANGFTFGIITWLPKDATHEYEMRCARVKEEWKNRFMPFVSEFHAIPYGVPKHEMVTVKNHTVVLFDDNAEVRKDWTASNERIAYDVNNIMEVLEMIYRKGV